MQDLIRIVFWGIAGVMLAVYFKGSKAEYSIFIGFAVALVIFGYAIQQIQMVMTQFEKIRTYLSGADSYLFILLKVIGITYVCEFGAGVCKDAGYQAVAGQIEVLGKLSVLFAGLPILLAVIEQIQQFM